ncbi:MAG TPA: hypothetical protein VKD71_01015 [Gemmataceae bacterium]|nr:hypothetical protein [Gemmataceae bacterium]
MLIYPTPPGLHANNLAIAGVGSVAGGLFGAAVGWILAWVFEKQSQAIPVVSQPASRAADDD